ncbi:hypothetical protein TNCV_3214421 [Trichonephila clavipes]|nr:hypothetical protein TNCV_3214421 [Trichonephila clavipes]
MIKSQYFRWLCLQRQDCRFHVWQHRGKRTIAACIRLRRTSPSPDVQSVLTTPNTLRRAGPIKCHMLVFDVKINVLEALKPLSARSFTNSGLTIGIWSIRDAPQPQISSS